MFFAEIYSEFDQYGETKCVIRYTIWNFQTRDIEFEWKFKISEMHSALIKRGIF